MSKKLLLSLLAVLAFTACSDNEEKTTSNSNRNPTYEHNEYGRYEFPRISDPSENLILIHKTANGEVNYSVEWDIEKKSQRWSCYQMYKSIMKDNVDRYYAGPGEDQYPQDPLLPVQYRWTTDPFYGSGYEHGHICPSADRLNSEESNYQTFYLTNMMPQKERFNRKGWVWENMERKVRNWAKQNNYTFCDTMYVCKGGTIDNKSQIITTLSNGLIVPKYYYMAILISKKQSNGTMKYDAMAFWIEHKESSDNGTALAKYVITIDELEKKTGIDFFCNLPDNIENQVESTVNMKLWGYN